MYRVRKIFKVPVGHRLSKHKGLCKNIHGHNLKLEIQYSCHTLNTDDMVMDFKILKEVVNETLDRFDHTTIFNATDTKNIELFEEAGYRVKTLSDRNEDPTAEVFSKFMFEQLRSRFDGRTLDFIRVWENDDSMAEYTE